MAILSAFSLIRGLAILHFTLAYVLMTSPQLLTEQALVMILGEAMHLVRYSAQQLFISINVIPDSRK
jgi:Increased loss of mitochondrial DNA protein 1